MTLPVPQPLVGEDQPIRIVIADDNATVRAGLRAHLMAQSGLAVIGEAADGEQAWVSACALHPDVLLLDLSMPRVSGLEAAERIVADCPTVRIIVLTIHEERDYVALLTRVGAAGYVLKRTVTASLVPAIRAVVAGGAYIDPAVRGDEESGAPQPPTESAPDEHEALTGSEDRMLRLVAEGRSNQEIATTLGLTLAAVSHGRGTGMAKLGLHSRAALVRHATARGWLKLES